jgi:hypothetical protein
MISQTDLSALEDHFHVPKYEKSSSRTIISAVPVPAALSRTLSHSSIEYTKSEDPEGLSANNVTWRFLAAFGCLCVINLVCAIDATILSVALPVCTLTLPLEDVLITPYLDHCISTSWIRNRSFLEWNVISSYKHRCKFSAFPSRLCYAFGVKLRMTGPLRMFYH